MVLHITNDYSGSTVYMNLIRELDTLGLSQIVYNPVREQKRMGINSVDFKTARSEIIYRPILNYHVDRYLYPWKIKKILKDIQKQIDFSKVTFIHAHTWYSDGGVAYELSKRYGIPYIVTIRNTDLNLFQKKLKYVRPYGRKILEQAQKVILISAAYKERILAQNSLKPILSQLEEKIEIIPNGVDPFWIKNATEQRKVIKEPVKILYIGKFDSGKNILNLVKAICSLNNERIQCSLDLVGGGGQDEEEIMLYVHRYPEIFVYHGKIYDKTKLMKVMRSCDFFAMPSRNETFGLVYVEAMLQGLPILYTTGEGIDGFYTETIGEKVSTGSVEEIEEKLLTLIDNYNSYIIPTNDLLENHNWANIAAIYKRIYEESVK